MIKDPNNQYAVLLISMHEDRKSGNVKAVFPSWEDVGSDTEFDPTQHARVVIAERTLIMSQTDAKKISVGMDVRVYARCYFESAEFFAREGFSSVN